MAFRWSSVLLGSLAALAIASVLSGCADDRLRLTSPAFAEGARLPARFSCDGAGVSPPLRWSPIADGNGQVALVLRDLDTAGDVGFHWVVVDIPPARRDLATGRLPSGANVLPEGTGSTRYRPPCPPRKDDPHRYAFTLYALSARPAISVQTPPREAEEAIEDAASARGTLTGYYGRP